MDLIPAPPGQRGNLSSGVNWFIRLRPDSDGKFGRFEAFNLETKKCCGSTASARRNHLRARHRGRRCLRRLARPLLSRLRRRDGQRLWQMRLNDMPSSCPVSYSVNGKQYVAVVVGDGGAQSATFPVLVPEIQIPPDHGAAVWVFELPDKN